MREISAAPRVTRAVHATAALLERLRIEGMFVGRVAEAAWVGGRVESGPVDLVALMNAPQKNQLAVMASHRGFRVEREEIEASEELDLVPLNFVDGDGEVRVHVLLASNALYGRMVSAAVPARIEEREIRVPRAEDLALMLVLAEREEAVLRLERLEGFDANAFRDRLISIGLGGRVASG